MNRDGFSLIEVMVGMLIFTVGVMALASSTGFVSMQLQSADLRTERSVAYQQITERMRAMPFDDVLDRADGDAITIGHYDLWWDVESLRWALKEVEIYSRGPAFRDGSRQENVVDTLVFRLARPVR